MKVPFLNLSILKATSLQHIQNVLAMKRRDVTDLENRLDAAKMNISLRDAELARLREALWFAQAGGYAKADGGNAAIPESGVLEYEERRRWTRDEYLELDGRVKVAGLSQDQMQGLAVAGTVEFRGLKWKLGSMSRDRPSAAWSRGDFEPPVEFELTAFADPTETVPDFKRHGA